MCSHRRERLIASYHVDGFCLKRNTVFQFHGCRWHGCLKCYAEKHQKTITFVMKKLGKRGLTREMQYAWTLKRKNLSLKWGLKWSSVGNTIFTKCQFIWKRKGKNLSARHHVWYWDNAKCSQTSKGDKMSTCHVCFFGRHLKQRARTDFQHRPKRACSEILGGACAKVYRKPKRHAAIHFRGFLFLAAAAATSLVNQGCFQFPILGFNSGCYDRNLIKKHFVTHVAQFDDVKVANKQNKVMFMSYGQVCGH